MGAGEDGRCRLIVAQPSCLEMTKTRGDGRRRRGGVFWLALAMSTTARIFAQVSSEERYIAKFGLRHGCRNEPGGRSARVVCFHRSRSNRWPMPAPNIRQSTGAVNWFFALLQRSAGKWFRRLPRGLKITNSDAGRRSASIHLRQGFKSGDVFQGGATSSLMISAEERRDAGRSGGPSVSDGLGAVGAKRPRPEVIAA